MNPASPIATSLLFLLGLSAPADQPASPDVWAAYQQARIAAGRDASAQVDLALWCESNGLRPEARKHLAMAVLLDPANPAARGLLGQVRAGDGWARPADLVRRDAADPARAPLLAEYRARLDRATDRADDHHRLALWCEQNGLDPEADAHWAAVVRLDPSNVIARKRLGYKKQADGRWLTDAQAAAEHAEAAAQQDANERLVPLLASLARSLRSADPDERAAAEIALSRIDEPRAVIPIWRVLATSDAEGRRRAVQALGQIDSRPSSRALATLALHAPEADLRRQAVETLIGRDPREFADLAIPLFRDPISYQVQPVTGPGSTGGLLVEGKEANLQRIYQTPAVFVPLLPTDTLGTDAFGLPVIRRFAGMASSNVRLPASQAIPLLDRERDARRNLADLLPTHGLSESSSSQWEQAISTVGTADLDAIRADLAAPLPEDAKHGAHRAIGRALTASSTRYAIVEIPVGQMMAEAERAAFVSQRQLEADVASIEALNTQIREQNERAALLLTSTTGQNLGIDRETWANWYRDQLGFNPVPRSPGSRPRPTISQHVAPAYVPQIPPPLIQTFLSPINVSSVLVYSCFGAGTPVHTRSGLRPIEQVRVGDLLLSQDPASGSLSYRPVVAVQHNPPSRTLRVRAGGQTIVTSIFHRFWKAQEGWAMARELKPGDPLRALGSRLAVEAVETAGVEPVFNLEVDGTHTFFTGEKGLLVHDTTVPDFRARPFDSPRSLVASD